MYKRVDDTEGVVEGFCYFNQDGNEERVQLSGNLVELVDVAGYEVNVFFCEDIPNLIKALQAAYDCIKGGA